MNQQEQIDSLNKQIEELRYVCAEAYILAGAYDASVLALDNLSAAANGDPIPHESFLPVASHDYQTEIDALRKELELKNGHNAMLLNATNAIANPNSNLHIWKNYSARMSDSAVMRSIARKAADATSEQIESYIAEIKQKADQEGFDRASSLAKCDRYYPSLEQVISQAKDEQRESDAKVCEIHPSKWSYPSELPHPAIACEECAEAIRNNKE